MGREPLTARAAACTVSNTAAPTAPAGPSQQHTALLPTQGNSGVIPPALLLQLCGTSPEQRQPPAPPRLANPEGQQHLQFAQSLPELCHSPPLTLEKSLHPLENSSKAAKKPSLFSLPAHKHEASATELLTESRALGSGSQHSPLSPELPS